MPGNYSEKVMEHFRNPRNVGDMPDADGIGHVGNPVCIPANSLIHTNSTIKDIKDIETDTKVLSHDGKYHIVSKTYQKEHNGTLFNIKVHNLGSSSSTPDHHILALKTSPYAYKHKAAKTLKPDWFCAEELEKGDVILYPIPKETEDKDFIDFDIPILKWDFKSKKLPLKIPINYEFRRLAGYYLAEGYVRTQKCKGTLGFVFHERETAYLVDVILSIKNLFGLDPSHIRNKNNACTIEFYSARLARFFEELFGKGAANKKIPHWMMLLSPEKQEDIICGLWRGDGYINDKTAKFVTISQQLAYQVKFLLLRQQLIFSFLCGKAYGMHKKSYSIYIKEDSALKKLAGIIGVKINRAPKKKSPIKSWFDENYYYTPIRSIQLSDFKGKVYNLEVDEAHSYTSSALALHNCGDIMEMYIKVKDNVIVDAKFKTFGCGAAIATSSMVTELVKGKTIDEALKISNQTVIDALDGLPPVKRHCSVLAEDALKSAIDDYLKKSTGKGLPGFKPHE